MESSRIQHRSVQVNAFFDLTPEKLLDNVEAALGEGARATGRCLTLNSMENRVYEIELEDREPVIAKFYRPLRWSRETILEEHRFSLLLNENEIPAVSPLALNNGETLASVKIADAAEIYFTLFPKVRGRIQQELDSAQLQQIGRYLARMHNLGEKFAAPHRPRIDTETHARAPLKFLLESGMLDPQLEKVFEARVDELAAKAEAQLSDVKTFLTHGDCHLGNVLWNGEQCFLVDFDDCAVAPAVQDIWLVVRGRDEHARSQRMEMIRGYEQFREFDDTEFKLIEGLRALRMVHYSAWIARRWDDPTFKNAFPDFGSYRYWQTQVADLEEQLRLM